jgi:hypothetical protein
MHAFGRQAMKRTNLIAVACACVALALRGPALAAEEGSTWDRYVPRTFKSIIDQHLDSARNVDQLYTGDDFASRITVIYTGQKRPLAGKRSDFLVKVFAKTWHQPELVKLFKSEILVREGGAELWVPLQESLLPSLSAEVAAGGQVMLFATWLGAFRQGDKIEWVFTINEFEAVGGQ